MNAATTITTITTKPTKSPFDIAAKRKPSTTVTGKTLPKQTLPHRALAKEQITKPKEAF